MNQLEEISLSVCETNDFADLGTNLGWAEQNWTVLLAGWTWTWSVFRKDPLWYAKLELVLVQRNCYVDKKVSKNQRNLLCPRVKDRPDQFSELKKFWVSGFFKLDFSGR